jgi:hypothetical protein
MTINRVVIGDDGGDTGVGLTMHIDDVVLSTTPVGP